tara:strand:+ start:66695 stop:67099 length:405 start_codon:yes stop_codon:yes gene_type:complete
MRVDKNTAGIIIALITSVAGLGTALINHYSTNEGAVVESEKKNRKGYNATRRSIVKVAEDVDANAKRIDMLENHIILQDQTIRALLSGRVLTSDPPPVPKDLTADRKRRKKRPSTRKRAEPPSYDVTQSQGGGN